MGNWERRKEFSKRGFFVFVLVLGPCYLQLIGLGKRYKNKTVNNDVINDGLV